MTITTEDIIWLLQLKGMGRSKIIKLIELSSHQPKNWHELGDIVNEFSNKLRYPTYSISEFNVAREQSFRIINKSEEIGVKILGYCDLGFPQDLKTISNPPVILNVIGDYSHVWSLNSVAVIGTRQPTNFGLSIGERLGFLFANAGINVISGLAVGCDAAGHIGALSANGITTAVLAHGLDHIYPKENKELANKIVESGGLLISEYLVGTRPFSSFFVERDRLQAALSKAVVVVETDIKGGTMHTVGFATNNNRIVAAVNHQEKQKSEKSRGNEMLIHNGMALPISNIDDINALIAKVGGNPIQTEQLKTIKDKMVLTKIAEPILLNDEVVQDNKKSTKIDSKTKKELKKKKASTSSKKKNETPSNNRKNEAKGKIAEPNKLKSSDNTIDLQQKLPF